MWVGEIGIENIVMRSMSSVYILSDCFPGFDFFNFFVNFFVVVVHFFRYLCMDVLSVVVVADWNGVDGLSDFLRLSNIWQIISKRFSRCPFILGSSRSLCFSGSKVRQGSKTSWTLTTR